jgi:hypothetical protein
VLLNRTKDAQHHWQRLTGSEIAVISLARFESATEVIDYRAVEVAVSVIQSDGNLPHLIQAELGQGRSGETPIPHPFASSRN